MMTDTSLLNDLVTNSSTRSVRLRLACDACTTAKVRCSRTHPCERCEENEQGKECCYSASKRHGKRVRHRKAELAIPRSSNTGSVATGDLSLQSENHSHALGDPASEIGDSFGMLDGWAFHNRDMTLDFEDMETISWWKSLEFVSDTSPSQSSGIASRDLSLSPGQMTAIESTTSRSTKTYSTNMHGPKHFHDCEVMALGILRSLHFHPNTDQTTNMGENQEGPSQCQALLKQSYSIPSIDTVLSTNKAALANIIPLLKCSCARSPHMGALYSAILFKIIFWYDYFMTSGRHVDLESQPVKFQLGMLDLDEEDQATLQRTVLLRELRKVDRIMGIFDSIYEGEEEIPDWHTSVVKRMRGDLHAIIENIRKGEEELL
ncbi:fusarubin cluster-transcription factor [Fusarium heterosporum]|uniref:Fusarubin cluster-transcription factor n=1 Tax=Fusarium heterosporum TaxID=42747 RepID=A0A8H5T139_FUSHE|nr:fusarubin cluster-transcription factor [Fusarium heterosporum]